MGVSRRWGFVILSLLPALLIVLVAEAWLQWTQWRRYVHRNAAGAVEVTIHRPSEDPHLVYELNPGATAEYDGVTIRINSSGFRDDEFPGPKAAIGERIMLLGDSVAFGFGVPMTEAFPQALEEILARSSADSVAPVVYNLAVPGYSTEEEMRLLEKWKDRLRPDTIVWSYVLNDAWAESGGGQRWYFGEPRSELLKFARSGLTLARYRLSGTRFDLYRHTHTEAAEEVRTRFAEMGRLNREGPRVDGRPGSEFSSDQLHPNTAGHALIAATLAERLVQYPK